MYVYVSWELNVTGTFYRLNVTGTFYRLNVTGRFYNYLLAHFQCVGTCIYDVDLFSLLESPPAPNPAVREPVS